MCGIIAPYLTAVKKAVARPAIPSALVVLGNEASDLDSMVSALVFACALSRNSQGRLTVPLIPIPGEDFRLRTEAVYVFQAAGIHPQHLIFADDAGDLLTAADCVALVDHNRPVQGLSDRSLRVTAILDHHRDEGLYPDANPRRILPVGSCATLAAQEAQTLYPELLSDRAAARLLLGTILLDTVNLNPDAGRTTAQDIAMARKLETAAGIDPSAYYQAIRAAKFDTSGLSTEDLLRKDFKQYDMDGLRCGIASVTLALGDWLEKDPGLTDKLAVFAGKKRLDILITMNAYHAPDFSRDLAFWCADQDLHDRLAVLLDKHNLRLTPVKSHQAQPARPNVSFAHQDNLAVSRKKLAPILLNGLPT
ncbi:MAG TPA: pyrophosphatase [Desulfobacteraceae bacterium]|nr:pyrophosphatase [Desulfobacteraceae bacterium]|tara:strand:+ start:1803 stop:2894 length:1092 start_codon:yes stop_codon:yes gene_type:complete